jgi:hypothetical protein
MLERLLCIDFEASALENGYPMEVGVAEVATGAVRSWGSFRIRVKLGHKELACQKTCVAQPLSGSP